ncbi:hypothetical protein [Acinetobacter sp. P1(2025)]|uniref:hypothetical protein n=1 Tax=Acinetobacter sp. P1(2025) TaxID=3446120 RepID=UPI003F52DF10
MQKIDFGVIADYSLGFSDIVLDVFNPSVVKSKIEVMLLTQKLLSPDTTHCSISVDYSKNRRATAFAMNSIQETILSLVDKGQSVFIDADAFLDKAFLKKLNLATLKQGTPYMELDFADGTWRSHRAEHFTWNPLHGMSFDEMVAFFDHLFFGLGGCSKALIKHVLTLEAESNMGYVTFKSLADTLDALPSNVNKDEVQVLRTLLDALNKLFKNELGLSDIGSQRKIGVNDIFHNGGVLVIKNSKPVKRHELSFNAVLQALHFNAKWTFYNNKAVIQSKTFVFMSNINRKLEDRDLNITSRRFEVGRSCNEKIVYLFDSEKKDDYLYLNLENVVMGNCNLHMSINHRGRIKSKLDFGF